MGKTIRKVKSRKDKYMGIPIIYNQPLPAMLTWLCGETPAEAVFHYKQATQKQPIAVHELFGVFWGMGE